MVVRLDLNKMKYSGWDINQHYQAKKKPRKFNFCCARKNVVCSDTIFQAEMY